MTIGSHQPLTGVAAPGYSEIAPASKAYFDYINAQGGINGRKIDYKFLDDAYDPTKTNQVVRELVTQDKVFAIFNGLGTPTHSAVVDYLNAQKVPDLFVASGCSCWNEPSKRPYTFGWQTDYIIEGKILGKYVADNFKGKKIGYLYQNDDFGQDGVKGLDMEIPANMVVDKQGYSPTNTSMAAQVSSLKAKGAEVVVAFTVPAFTSIYALTAAQLGFKPQLVVSNVGSDPTTLDLLLKNFSKGKANGALTDGIISDSYLPSSSDTANSWIALFKKIHDADPTVSKLPFDGNVLYGMAAAYTFAQALQAAGQNPTRASIVKAVEAGGFSKNGPGLVPFRFSASDHAGFSGVQIAKVTGGKATLLGPIETTDDGSGGIMTYTGTQPTAPSTGLPPKA
ncbi:MAG TPA: ABC transporter substrate-binding protein [Mycobacteriales bacterium]|nr:ABC transporter substrate-binding protein [Mycobacteriales bacterium]